MQLNFLRNKKGGEKFLSIWWFLVLVIVGIGTVGAVLMYYSANIDVRSDEAKIVSDKLSDCIINNGFLSPAVLEDKFSVLDYCNLSLYIFSEQQKQFYFKIQLSDEAGKPLRNDILQGYTDIQRQCDWQKPTSTGGAITAEYYAKCIDSSVEFLYYKDEELKTGKCEILVGSNQNGQKISSTGGGQ